MGGMTNMGSEGKWTKIGSSATSPVSNTQRKEVFADTYYLVVGFEVNYPSAYKDGVHILDEDYGHAFFYTTKNAVVTQFFSFGPISRGKVGWLNSGVTTGALIKDGYADARQGTPDYPISENIRLFKIDITASQAERVITETNKVRQEITSGKQKYTAWINDTCAETAKEILDDAGVKTPSGSGPISKGGWEVIYAVNPYRWHENFVKAGVREVPVKHGDLPKEGMMVVGSKDAFYAPLHVSWLARRFADSAVVGYAQLHGAAGSTSTAATTGGAANRAADPSNTGDPFRTLRTTP
jgi:hypothetical protein